MPSRMQVVAEDSYLNEVQNSVYGHSGRTEGFKLILQKPDGPESRERTPNKRPSPLDRSRGDAQTPFSLFTYKHLKVKLA
ncbi:hypothetical protein INR49_005727 [Caranx melampygus]|nr:hypothetical protein INR49_005727 [Caranx melampygus]